MTADPRFLRGIRPLLAGLLLLAAAPAAAQGAAPPPDTPHTAVARPGIHGRLLDDRTGQPVAEARITLIDGLHRRAGRATTGPDGAFHFDVPAVDAYSLRAERVGYRRTESAAIRAAPGARVDVELRVATDAVVLAPLTVVSRTGTLVRDRQLGEFMRRRERQPFGRFVGPEEIERIRPVHASQVLHRLPRVQVLGDFRRQVTLPMQPPTASTDRCTPNVYVDGVPLHVGGEISIDELVPAGNLAAVELYESPAFTPGEFSAHQDPGCGVLVFWTRAAADRR